MDRQDPPHIPEGTGDPLRIKRVALRLTNWTERWVPDAWVVALMLTLVVFLIAIAWGGETPFTATRAWGEGFWELLTLMAQFAFAIIVAYAVASAAPVSRLLSRLASIPNRDKPWQAILLMAIFAIVTGWINWAVTIVASAVFVPFVARNNPNVDYRLLVTAAYLGIGTIWHAGLSGTAPLITATPGNFLIQNGVISDTIPVSQTVFTSWNLIMSLIVATVGIAIVVAMTPSSEDARTISREQAEELIKTDAPTRPDRQLTPAEKMEWWPGWNVIFGLATTGYLVFLIVTGGFAAWTIDAYNLLFLSLAIWLHWRPASFLPAVQEGVKGAWGVLIQFPFYAGIFGLIQNTALVNKLSGLFEGITTPTTFAPILYWYSGILNYFVPSGGSKWAIEAPYLIEAGEAQGFSPAAITIAYAWGDMMSNIIQPFWAIPLLAIVGLKFGEILGYCIIIFIALLAIGSIGMFFLPAGLGT